MDSGMNERIQELIAQAREPLHNKDLPFNQGLMEYSEKFAELIVKDVRWVMQTAADDFILDKNYDAVKGVGRCMRRVKQHFGVEE